VTSSVGAVARGVALAGVVATGLTSAASREAASIEYSSRHLILAGDPAAVAVEKAAKVLPRANQSVWMRLERTFFVHFGPNTFRGVEWGDGREDPSLFAPTALDADQWVRAMKGAGGRLLILVSKHHDGFCLWPTRYTTHSVVASPWLGGEGDLVGSVAEAARAHGLELGVYLSPADLYQLRTNPTNPRGYYGNGSAKVRSVIPTAPASFETDPTRGREPAAGFGSYTYEVDDYNRYFLNQVYELLTEYGPVSVVWFDGANPDPSVPQTYDHAAWYDLIRRLRPAAVISVKGPDTRWVGNEGGIGRTAEWSVIPLSQSPESFGWPDMQEADLGSRAKLTPGSHLWWYPAEVNTSILEGWFWSAEKRTKSAARLVDYFYTSIGRNGNMLLNLAPDTRGLIPDDQLASLRTMADVVDATFAKDPAAAASFSADSSNPGNPPAQLHDGNLDTWWEAAPGRTSATVTLSFSAATTFDVVSLQEAVDHRSQRIESFVVETWDGSNWTAPPTVDDQATVGHKRLLRLAVPVTTNSMRILITGSRLEPTLAEMGVFLQALPAAPAVSERGRDGLITLSHPHPQPIVYTVDGTPPTPRSQVYERPVPLPDGGTLQAAVLTSEERPGLIAVKTVVGIAPTGWTARRTAGSDAGAPGFDADRAIDADAATQWKARASGDGVPPALTVDMGRARRIGGFAYLPRQDWVFEGVADRYRFETSLDGTRWATQVASGSFDNIENSPLLREVRFAPVKARFFRFTALRDVERSGWSGAAEITVLPANGR
jgi:alpha-L-fucosidase